MDSLTERLADMLRRLSVYFPEELMVIADNLVAEFDAAAAAQEKPVRPITDDELDAAYDAFTGCYDAEIERLRTDRNIEKKWRKDSDERAEVAEAERDALKARIEGAPIWEPTAAEVSDVNADIPDESSFVGKRVALVLIDDGEGDKA